MAQRDPDRDHRSNRNRRRTSVTGLDQALSTRPWDDQPDRLKGDLRTDVALECGWGRLLFGQTFADHEALIAEVAKEEPGRRDICMYVREPHVAVSKAPQELFIDPSHTYRLWLHTLRPGAEPVRGVVVRKMAREADADAVNRIYTEAGMVTAPTETLWRNQLTQTFTYLVAEDAGSGEVIGTVTGVDHTYAFNDPEGGTSLWCLAVDPQTSRPGVGRALVRTLAERYQGRGRAYLDLSVVHDNAPAIALYEQLGFVRVPVFAVKRKNPINERLFAAAPAQGIADLNPYARLIADEALRRGITVHVTDAESGLLRLPHGGRTVHTRESLSELTNAVAMSRCDDKRLTRRLLADAGLRPTHHYLIHPNPWPKPGHLKRRWHGHPVFPALLALGGQLELRSNFGLYVLEFKRALELAGRPDAKVVSFRGESEAISPFEAKYLASGHTLERLTVNLENS